MKLSPDLKKIIVFRALQLGDMLCFIPAMRALRHAYPNAHITLTGLPWARLLTDRFNEYFDEFIWFPGFPGLPEQPVSPAAFIEFLKRVQEQHFDLALQMQGNGYLVNPMVELFAAKYTAGFYKPHDYKTNHDYFLEYPDQGSEIERHLKLMEFLGVESQGTNLEFPLTSADQKDFNKIKLEINTKEYVCIHPGSRGSWRQWPVEHFASIADYCISCGYKAVITGTNDEISIISDVISHMKHTPVNAVGKTSLGAIGILIKNAAALISNCTGVSHMAAAFKTPSIVISMDGEPERWGPINKRIHRTINWLDEPGYDFVLAQTDSLLHQLNEE